MLFGVSFDQFFVLTRGFLRFDIWNTEIVQDYAALMGDLKCLKNRDRAKSALIKTALIGDPLYY